MNNETHLIVFKANRTFYSRKYNAKVRLIDVLQAIKDGEEIVVRDFTGRDITEHTISRAFLKHVILPQNIYRNLIKDYYEVN